jgi:transcriptional regulator with XRE-family HTH domain
VGATAGSSANQSGQASPLVSRLVVGRRLRLLRETMGLTAEDAGHVIQAPAVAVSRMEQGLADFQLPHVATLCTLYGVTDQGARATLLGLARRANSAEWWHPYRDVVPGWFEHYLSLEQAASLIRAFEVHAIPGLLQTPGYARALITLVYGNSPAARVERQVELRMRRQDILHSRQPPRLWVVLDEAALRRPRGSRAIMRGQLHHLINACDMTGITIDVLPPWTGSHPPGGPVTVLRMPDPQLPDVVCLEQLTSARYCETPAECEYYVHLFNVLATQAGAAGRTEDVLSRILREL